MPTTAPGIDPNCLTLASHFLAATLTVDAPTPEKIAADTKSLGEAIQAAADGWFLVRERSAG